MIRCLVVEDEFAAQQLLLKKLNVFYPDVEVLAVVNNKAEAIDFIKNNSLDLVFLDVRIKGGTGIDVLQEVPDRQFEAIFVTAYDDYAIHALNENASYYLLKPLRNADFQKGMEAVLKRIRAKKEPDFIFVPYKGVDIRIPVKEIIYLESDGAYTYLVTETERYISSRNLGYYEKKFPAYRFIRSHHSFIVNLSHVHSFKKGRSGALLMGNGVEIPVSQRRMMDFRKAAERFKTDR